MQPREGDFGEQLFTFLHSTLPLKKRTNGLDL
jgi:hypothetical protein